MKRWESLVDQKIREAMEQGEFDDLPGKGEPIDTSENPFEDPEMRLAHRDVAQRRLRAVMDRRA